MQSLETIKSTLANHKRELSENYKIKEIGVFGSFVKGNQQNQSDVDILVEFEASADLSLLDFIGLENYLSELLGAKVDLVEKQTLKPRIGRHVLDEVVRI
jgi:predicted nucleotidyltransferase